MTRGEGNEMTPGQWGDPAWGPSRPPYAGQMTRPTLTSLTHGGGCACKLSSNELTDALSVLMTHPVMSHPNLTVGIGTSDDAGVWVIDEGLALVQTVDFFTPVVDDPYDWGRVAAANAVSDIYAMGSRPVTALQLVGWPRDELGSGAIGEVIRGGADVIAESGAVIVGGHSIDSPEPTYGFAVTGVARPDDIVSNAGARPGDLLVLTKPLGVGIATTAIKRGKATPELTAAAIASMTTLNAAASEAMMQVGVNAATDVTGFGLLGHLREIARASDVGAEVDISAIPVLGGVAELAEARVFAGGSARNLSAAGDYTDFGDTPETWRMILSDAQTSGGLLISVDPRLADDLVSALEISRAPAAAIVGRVVAGPPSISVVGRAP